MKRIDKKSFKKSAGKCRLCGETKYELLDTHRLTPGSDGGKYTDANSVVLCSNCHRSVHAGFVKLERYYLCTDGTCKLLIIRNGVEEFV
jgi:5-methylcytosine-specific restriction endonuclease McrA